MSKKSRPVGRAERAAAAMHEQQQQERRRRNLMVGGVVLALLVIIVGGYFLSRALDTSKDVQAPAAGGSKYGLTIGPDDAPHDVVIYEDFLCPYCGQLEDASRDDLARLAADGKVQVEYRPFNLLSTIGDYSERSAAVFAVVLDKSGPDVAKKLHDLLYENQPSESGPFPSDDDLIKLAVEAGADEAELKKGLAAGDGKAWVGDATQAALDAGVRGTPTVLLDGKVFQDGRTMDDLASNLVDKIG
ncbi:thioredoxin domain-containing protein [Nocardioides sp.]|uniref:DsbA family protein n=1 Tax=Nocardioides sp. TaxID=35761 RepID=UPI00262E4C1B|nr:thioredoxin domain-containing protein [Nocardioides sp.]